MAYHGTVMNSFGSDPKARKSERIEINRPDPGVPYSLLPEDHHGSLGCVSPPTNLLDFESTMYQYMVSICSLFLFHFFVYIHTWCLVYYTWYKTCDDFGVPVCDFESVPRIFYILESL